MNVMSNIQSTIFCSLFFFSLNISLYSDWNIRFDWTIRDKLFKPNIPVDMKNKFLML